MLRRAEEKDRKELLALWQESFGDSAQDIEEFFEFNIAAADVFVEDDGGISAALYGLPCSLEWEGRTLSARYLYAVATAAARRSQGIMSRLIPFAHEQMEKGGAKAFWLYPAGSSLRGFYEKFGYRTVRSATKRVVAAKPVDLPVEVLAPDAAAELRRELLCSKNAIGWGASALDYAAAFYDAQWCRVGDALALVHKEGEALTVPELIGDAPVLTAQALCTHFNTEKAEVVLPCWCGGEDKPSPMLRVAGVIPDAVYAGLELN